MWPPLTVEDIPKRLRSIVPILVKLHHSYSSYCSDEQTLSRYVLTFISAGCNSDSYLSPVQAHQHHENPQ